MHLYRNKKKKDVQELTIGDFKRYLLKSNDESHKNITTKERLTSEAMQNVSDIINSKEVE